MRNLYTKRNFERLARLLGITWGANTYMRAWELAGANGDRKKFLATVTEEIYACKRSKEIPNRKVR